GSTGGDAHEQALLPGGAAGGLDRVFAGDGDHLVVDAGVQDLRHEVRPETLDLVRTSLASGEHGGLGRLHGDDLHLRLALLEHLSHTGDRAAGAHPGDDDVHTA